MPKLRKLDAATETQAIAFVQKHIELSGGLFHGRELWRAALKYELCGQVELPEQAVRSFKAMKEFSPLRLLFIRRPMTWDLEVAARLIADAKRGDPDADQVLREVAAKYLERDELLPKPLADYAATSLRAHSDRKKRKQRSRKTESRDRRLARVVYAVSQKFGLEPTRNRATDRPCACSIVAVAIKKSESTVTNAWQVNQDFVRSSTTRSIVADFIELDHVLATDQELYNNLARREHLVSDGAGRTFSIKVEYDDAQLVIKATRSRSQRHETKKMIDENRKLKSGAMSH
jgi:hypothetical protein